MTKIKITGLEKETTRLKLRISSAIAKSKFKDVMQEDVVKEVRRSGLVPRLRSSTVRNRKYIARYNTTHPSYRAGKSNLTITGQLLDAIRVKYVTRSFNFVFDALKSKHKKYKTKKGRSKATTPSLRELLKWQNDARPILQVFQSREFKSKIERKLVSAIKRFFK